MGKRKVYYRELRLNKMPNITECKLAKLRKHIINF